MSFTSRNPNCIKRKKKWRRCELMFVNRSYFTILHSSTLYRCYSCFQADITRSCGKQWYVSLIWQHSGGQINQLMRFHDDGVVRSENVGPLTLFACGFLTYIHKMYGLRYAYTKKHIISFFLQHNIFLHESVLPLVIYMHVYKVHIQYNRMSTYDYSACFEW